MNKTIWWLVGRQQAGKTMFGVTMGSYGAQVLLIGQQLRQRFSPAEFAKESNPFAPEMTEKLVQDMIYAEIERFIHNTNSLLVIDSAPRNDAQFNILFSVSMMSKVILITERYDIRKNRARKTYSGDLTLFDAREGPETIWMDDIKSKCDFNRIEYISLLGSNQ